MTANTMLRTDTEIGSTPDSTTSRRGASDFASCAASTTRAADMATST